ncbi:MAG: hypothetical protein ACUVXI_01675 [bacterium]
MFPSSEDDAWKGVVYVPWMYDDGPDEEFIDRISEATQEALRRACEEYPPEQSETIGLEVLLALLSSMAPTWGDERYEKFWHAVDEIKRVSEAIGKRG